jgi:hypothetical protein
VTLPLKVLTVEYLGERNAKYIKLNFFAAVQLAQ